MLNTSSYTLYSGGLKGTEAEFGRIAELWGVREITFSYKGHQMERAKDVYVLTEDELQQGDVSMAIVSKRMGRTYSEAEKIRKVIQSIFHMVNKGHQVFVIGWIQPDKTVKGGTGWAVELGKFFGRPISVFDQDKNTWFSWDGSGWTPDEPVISHKTFTGTGTRYLSDQGKQAIRELYERSFGQPPAQA